MVLSIGQSVVSRCPASLEDFLASSSRLVEASRDIRDQTKRKVTEKQGLLKIQQHEYAVSWPGDPSAPILGSEDATTCHIIVLRHPQSGVTSLTHADVMDGKSIDRIRDDMLELAKDKLGRKGAPLERVIDLHLIGGYLDEHCRSEELSLHLLQHFIKDASTKYLLQTACIGSLNTTYRDKGTAYPVVYGCGVEVASGEIWPATFPDSEPEELVRHIRCSFNDSSSKRYHRLYNCSKGQIRIEPFVPFKYPGMEFWLQAPNQVFLEHMSTSPKVEPPNFVARMKATIKAVSETQDPLETFFGGGNPLVYQRNDRMVWVKVQDEDQQQPKVINQDNRSDAPILEKPQQNLVRLH